MMNTNRIETIPAARLGQYLLLTELGAGGMARVNLALARGPGHCDKLLVIKRIQERFAEDPDFVTMFLDEARLAARMRHPNLVQVNEVGQMDGRYYMAMEYLEGQSLGRVRSRLGSRRLPLRLHLQVLADVLSGLHHAHELCDVDRGPLHVIHRDATPDNIFITYDGSVKVLDFGIAKASDQSTETLAGTLKGKVTYMPPEQARGEKLDRRADVFTVGVMLWEAATGARMWNTCDHSTILRRLFANDIPAPRAANPLLGDRIEAVILKACAPRREDRQATAAELQEEIEALLAELGGRVPERELGQLVATHFDSERAQIRSRIQGSLRQVSKQADLAPSRSITRAEPASALARRAEPRAPSPRETGPAAPRREETAQPPSGSGTFVKTIHSRTAETAPARRRPFALGVCGAALALALVGAAAARTGVARISPAASGGGTKASVAAPTAAAPIAAPRTVSLRIQAHPREARLLLDDRPLSGNPFVGELPADAVGHRLSVEAPGHQGRVERLLLDRSRDLDIVLDPLPAPHPPETAVSTSARSVARDLRGRRLDDTNPYTARAAGAPRR
jgi:serine/threonine-protein kinase